MRHILRTNLMCIIQLLLLLLLLLLPLLSSSPSLRRSRLHLPDSVQQLHIQQPSIYAKPEAASAVLGS
jgi:hypothetical protein